MASINASALNTLFLGNPGSGKSTMTNLLYMHMTGIRETPVRSGVSFGGGLTQVLGAIPAGKNQYIMDTPGLDDVKTRDEAAREITRALRSGGRFRIVFVVTLEAGRARSADLATMKAILEAAPNIGNDFGIIVNKLTKQVIAALQTQESFVSLVAAFQTAEIPIVQERIYFNLFDPDLHDADDAAVLSGGCKLSPGVAAFLGSLPIIDLGAVNNVDPDTTAALIKRLMAQIEELKNDADERQRRYELALADERNRFDRFVSQTRAQQQSRVLCSIS